MALSVVTNSSPWTAITSTGPSPNEYMAVTWLVAGSILVSVPLAVEVTQTAFESDAICRGRSGIAMRARTWFVSGSMRYTTGATAHGTQTAEIFTARFLAPQSRGVPAETSFVVGSILTRPGAPGLVIKAPSSVRVSYRLWTQTASSVTAICWEERPM